MRRRIRIGLWIWLLLLLCGTPALRVQAVSSFAELQPKLTAAEAEFGRITVSWKALEAAQRYVVYRKGSSDTRWKKLGTVEAEAGTSYADDAVKPGRVYTYTVTAQSADGTVSSYVEKGIRAVAKIPPVVMKGCSASGTRVTVRWKRMPDVDGYRVLRRDGDGELTALKDLMDPAKTSYTDKKAKKGHTYTYAVYSLVKDDGTLRAGTEGANAQTIIVSLPAVESFAAATADGRVCLSWKVHSGADGYRIFRKVSGSKSYKKLMDVSPASQHSCWDTSVKPGVTYTYVIRPILKEGKKALLGVKSVEKTVTARPAMVLMTGVKRSGGKDVISWKAVSGAKGYVVYKKNDASGQKWVKAAEVGRKRTKASVDRDPGVTVYAVRAWAKGSGKHVAGSSFMTLSNAAPDYQGKKVLFIGDSITWGFSWNGKRTPIPYPARVAQLTGVSYTNAGISRCNLARGGSGDSISVMGRTENRKVSYRGYDVIVLAAGTNDYNHNISLGSTGSQSSRTFNGALNQWFDTVKSQNPDAQVLVVLPAYRQRFSQDFGKEGFRIKNSKGNTLADYRNACRKAAERNGAEVFDSYEAGLITASNAARMLCDGLHPTVEGYVQLGDAVAAALEPLLARN